MPSDARPTPRKKVRKKSSVPLVLSPAGRKNYDAKRNRVRPIKSEALAGSRPLSRPDKKIAPKTVDRRQRSSRTTARNNPYLRDAPHVKSRFTAGDVAKSVKAGADYIIARKMEDTAYGPIKHSKSELKIKKSGVDFKPSSASKELGKVGKEPVLTILENVSRPGYAVGNTAAQAAENIKKNRPVTKALGKAAERGIKLEQKRGFGEALNSLGVSKPVAGVLGFPLDVATDPTTWVTGGTGSLARKGATSAAVKAGEQTAKKAVKKLDKPVVAGREKTAAKIVHAEQKSADEAKAAVTSRTESSAVTQQRQQLAQMEATGRGGTAKAERIRRNVENSGKGTAKKVRKIEQRPVARADRVARQATPSENLSARARDRKFRQTAYDENGNLRRGGAVSLGFVTPRIPFTSKGGKTHAATFRFSRAGSKPEVVGRRTSAAARGAAANVRPTVARSARTNPHQLDEALGISRESVATETAGFARAQREMNALAHSLPPEKHEAFIRAIESGHLKDAKAALESEFGPLKKHVVDSLKYGIRQAQRSGYAIRPLKPVPVKPLKENLARVQAAHVATNRLRRVNKRLAQIDRKILTAKGAKNTARVASLQKSKRALLQIKGQIENSGLATRPTLNRHVTRAQKKVDTAQEIRSNSASGYFSHMRKDTVENQRVTGEEAIQERVDAAMGHPSGGGPSGTGTLTTAKRRRVRAPIDKQNRILEAEQQYSTDAPLVFGNTLVQNARMTAKGNRIQALAKLAAEHGREVKPINVRVPTSEMRRRGATAIEGPRPIGVSDRRLPDIPLRENEGVFWVGVENRVPVLHELDANQLRDAKRGYGTRANDAGTRRIRVPAEYPKKSGKIIVLDKEAVGKFHELYARPPKETGLRGTAQRGGEKWDKGMRGWKILATGTPGFHIRNTVSDTQMALNDVPPTSLVRLARESVSNLRYIRDSRRHVLARGERPRDAEIVKLGKSGTKTRKEWNDELEKNGVITTGVVGGEVRYGGTVTDEYGLAASGSRKHEIAQKLHVAGKGAALRDALQDRENLMRMAVYKHWREQGLSERAASRKVADAMVDYVETTRFERAGAKRAMPFYTFSARSIPKHAKVLATRPGKVASYEKLRHNVALATGGDAEGLDREQRFKQGLAGVPVGDSFVSAGLANASALNQLPVDLAQGNVKGEVARQLRFGASMLAPPLRWVPEFAPTLVGDDGYNFFFRGPIKPPAGDLVPAPRWAMDLPKGMRKQLNVMEYTDKKTGKKTVGWSGQASYVLSQIPGLAQAPIQLSQDLNRRGQSDLGRGLGFFGVKVDSSDPHAARLEAAFVQYKSNETQKKRLEKAGRQDTKEYKAVAALDKALKGFIQNESKRAGYKKPLFQPKTKKNKNPWESRGSRVGGEWGRTSSGPTGEWK